MFKKILTTFILISSVSGCSNLNNIESEEQERFANKTFSTSFEKGNPIFIVAGSTLDFHYSVCKNFVSNDIKPLTLKESCQTPFDLNKYKQKIGIVTSKESVELISIIVDGENLNFAVSDIVMEDGEMFKSIDVPTYAIYEKEPFVEIDRVLIDQLDYLLKHNYIYSYWVEMDGIHYTLDDQNDLMKKLLITDREPEDIETGVFDEDQLLILNFLNKFIDENNLKESIELLPSISVNMTNPDVAGALFIKKEQEDPSFRFVASNSDFKGTVGNVKPVLIILPNEMTKNKNNPISVTLANNEKITFSEDNYRRTDVGHFIIIDSELIDATVHHIESLNDFFLEYSNGEIISIENNVLSNSNKININLIKLTQITKK